MVLCFINNPTGWGPYIIWALKMMPFNCSRSLFPCGRSGLFCPVVGLFSPRPCPRPGWAPDPLMVRIRSPDGLVLGLAPATLKFGVRFPNEQNHGKQGATLCSSTGFLTGPIKGTAVINTHNKIQFIIIAQSPSCTRTTRKYPAPSAMCLVKILQSQYREGHRAVRGVSMRARPRMCLCVCENI